jgi:hypothetical protein
MLSTKITVVQTCLLHHTGYKMLIFNLLNILKPKKLTENDYDQNF